MKRLWLIRHGQTDYNAANKIQGSGIDAPLNQLGIAQAKLLANAICEQLSKEEVRLYSSSLIRAKQTAAFIAEKMQIPCISSDEVVELNFGVLEGMPMEDIANELEDLHNLWESGEVNVAAKEGESPKDAFKRAGNYIISQLEEITLDNAIFVIHGRLLRILLAGWLDGDLSEMSKYHHHNANINLLEYAEGVFKVLYLNDTKHLINVS
jgi:broad specificity phosphatase PhoE